MILSRQWFRFLLILAGSLSLFLTALPSSSFAKIEQWDFQDKDKFLFDSQKIQIKEGVAGLTATDPYRDQVREDFDKGNYELNTTAARSVVELTAQTVYETPGPEMPAPLSPFDPGMSALWHFDEPSGSNVLDEASRTVAKTSDTETVSSQNGFSFARSFDGEKSHIFVPHYQTFKFDRALTLEAWIRPQVTVGAKAQTLISRWQQVGAQKSFAFQISPAGKLDFVLSPDGALSKRHSGDTVLSPGVWYHVAAVFNGEDLRVYVNGVLDATPMPYQEGLHPSNNPIYIGSLINNKLEEFYKGIIDEVAFYNRPLSETELLTHAGNARGLAGLWHLNERGGPLADASGFGQHAMPVEKVGYETEGKIGTALRLDGKKQYLETPATSRFAANGSLTLEAWVKPDKVPGLGQTVTLISSVPDSETPDREIQGEYSLLLSGPEGALKAIASGINPVEITGKTPLMPNTWQHVAVTWAEGRANLYLNGILDASTVYKGILRTGKSGLRFGMDSKNLAPFSGVLDEVALYRRARTPAEIATSAGGMNPAGIYTSAVKDAGTDSVWRQFSWKEELPYGKGLSNQEIGLLHLYHLDEKNQNTFTDVRGETQASAMGTYAVGGMFSQARWFQTKGLDKIISQKNFPSLSTFAVSFWFQFASSQPGLNDRLFSIGDANPTAFRGPDGRMHVTMLGSREIVSENLVQDTQWHHFVLAADGRNLFLYIDGLLAGNSPFMSATAEAPLVLGNLKSVDTFQGAIDEVAFFNAPLSREKVFEHYLRAKLNLVFQVRTSQDAAFANASWRDLNGNLRLDPQAQAYTVGLWHFNDAKYFGRTGEVVDASRFSNHGVAYGRVTSTPLAIAGAGASLNGAGDSIQIADADNLHLNKFTLSAWIKPRHIQEQDAVILDKHYQKGSPAFSSYALELVSGNRLNVRVGHTRGYTQVQTDAPGEITSGKWNHVAATFNGKEIRLYINGELKKISFFQESIAYDAGSLYIGRYGASASRFFEGEIDEVAIESNVMELEEVAHLYETGRSQTMALTEGKLDIDRGRYFQYRALLASDMPVATPQFKEVEILANVFSTDRPAITNQIGVSYADISHFAEKLGPGNRGAVSYQLSNDGANWFYHNGRRWVIASGYSESNTADQIQTRIHDFAKEVGIGSFYFKAFLHSPNGVEAAELQNVEVEYLPNKLTMISPNGGEAWISGSEQAINWNSTGEVEKVNLEYSKDDFKSDFHSIAKNLPNTGNYSWTVPDDLATQVKVRVIDGLEPRVYDISDLSFRIAGTVKLITPNWNERWEVGSSQSIVWDTTGKVENVKLDFSTDDFVKAIYPIVASVKNEGKFSWKVTDPISSSVKVRISDVRDPLTYDKSNDTFTIHGRIHLLSPAGGERWIVGSRQEIKWENIGAIPGVLVEYQTSQKEEWVPIADKVLNQKSVAWEVPDEIDGSVKIRVTDIGDASVSVTSPEIAIIGGLRLISPSGGENWTIGSRRKISWQTVGTIPAVNLDYKLSTDDKWIPIIKSAANLGSYIWDIPEQSADLIAVRVTDASDDSIRADSVTPSRIIPDFILKSPNGGENYKIGSEADIIWETRGKVEKVKLEYSRDNFVKDIRSIIKEASNVGRFSWTLPDDAGTQMKVRISASDLSSSQDMSDGDFRIFSGFKMTAPQGGEKYEVGSLATLTWDTIGTVAQVRLEYSHDDFTKDTRLIANSIANTGRYTWTVPDDIGNGYSLKISDLRDLKTQDFAPGFFSVIGTFRILEPLGGESYTAGALTRIKWKGAGSVPFVRIDYSEDGFEKTFQTIAEQAPNTGMYEWLVPNLIGHQFKIRVWDPSHPDAQDVMSKPARIIGGFRLLAPNGGEIIYVGDQIDIQWEALGTIPTVKIEYSDDHFQKNIGEIADAYENTGTYHWQVPDLPTGAYFLRISDPRDVTANDLSNAAFKVRSRFTLISPNGGEGWAVGEKKKIAWQTTGSVPAVHLEYTIDDFASVKTIEEKAPNTGSYEWTLPEQVSQNVRVRVSDVKDFEAYDVADGPFRIQGIMNLESPAGGELWKVGEQRAIHWKTLGRVEGVRLEYSSDNFASEVKTIVDSIPNTGSYNWVVPDDISPNTKVRVLDLKDPRTQSLSPEPFQVAASFRMMGPNGGERWHASEKREITWATIGTVKEVNLEYSKDEFKTEPEIIDRGILNAGKFTWELPRDLGKNFKVRVCDSDHPEICDASDNLFELDAPFEWTYPQGDEMWPVGSDQELRWNVYGYVPRIFIQYAIQDPPVEWKTLIEELPNEGHFLFKVPDDISKAVRFRISDFEDADVFSVTEKPVQFVGTFEILTPNGGEKWLATSTQKISWKTMGTAPEVRLEYSGDDFKQDIKLIESAYKNIGSYEWIVPADLAPSVKVRVKDRNNDASFDISDGSFKILPHFQILTPNGGERWVSGDKVQIQWKTAGSVPRVRLDYGMREEGAEAYTWQPLAEVRGNLESYDWVIPTSISSDAKIRIYDERDTETTDESDESFKTLARFKMLAPRGDEILTMDEKYAIKWETFGQVPSVKLEYALQPSESDPKAPLGKIYQPGQKEGFQLIENLWANSGIYYWSVPDTAGEKVVIRVSDGRESEAFELGEAFRIRGTLKFDLPEGELQWPVGSQQTLRWKTVGTIPHIKLEYTQDGKVWKLIEESIPNSGSYGWLVPDDISQSVRLRISNVQNPAVFSEFERTINIRGAFQFTAPELNQKWTVASKQKIAWRTMGAIKRVWLDYSTGGEWTTVAGPLNNEGVYEWVIPDVIAPAVQFRIKDTDNPAATALSEIFSIRGALELTSPVGGEVWNVSSVRTIQWKTTGSIPFVRLEGYWEEGVSKSAAQETEVFGPQLPDATAVPAVPHANPWFIISEKQENTGIYEWTVPDKVGDHLKIRVTDIRDESVSQTSSQPFSIIGTFQVLNPKGGEVWTVNAQQQIVWSSQGSVAEVLLEYSRDDFYRDVNIIAAGVPNTGAALWTLPDSISDEVKVRVSDVRDKRAFHISEPFQIKGKLDFITPVANATLKVNAKEILNWRTTGTIPQVRLEYSRDDFQREIQVIENNLENQDSYEWRIPDIVSTTVKLRVMDLRDHSVLSVSAPFKVEGILNLKAPGAQEKIQVLGVAKILWDTVGTIPQIRLEYSRDEFNRDIHLMIPEVTNQGSYDWIVPDDIGPGVKIRVSNASNFSVSSVSPEPFKIHGALSFTTLTSGERWPVASVQGIRWENIGTIPQIKLEYSKDDFQNDTHVIAVNLTNENKFKWVIPDDITDNLRLRISDVRDPEVLAVTTFPASIMGQLNVIQPTQEDVLKVSEEALIQWEAVGTLPGVRLEYQTTDKENEAQTDFWKLITGLVENSGEYVWKVPNDISLKTRVRVSDARDLRVQAISSEFPIVGKVSLMAPAGGERWIVGTKHEVLWQSVGTITEVNLQYSTDGFVSEIQKIAEGLPNGGRMIWTVPDAISDHLQLRIQDPRMPELVSHISAPSSVVGDFVVSAPSMPVTWKVGSEARLEWQTVGSIAEIRIDFVSEEKEIQSEISDSDYLTILSTGLDHRKLSQPTVLNSQTRILQDKIPNQGFYSFHVPDWITERGSFKISDAKDASVYQMTPAVKIEGDLNFQAPLTPQVWTVQQTQVLEWATQGTIPQVALEYSTDHFQENIQVIQSGLSNGGKYSWQVPDEIAREVLVRVRDIRDEKVASVSGPIKIIGALQFIQPSANQILKVGMPLAVEWNTTGTIPNVRLEYSKDGFLKDSVTIAENLPNEGHYTWPAPDQIAKEIWLRVSDPRDNSVLSITPDPIEIQGALEITSLQDQERFVVNSEQNLTWKTIGTIPQVRLEYSSDGFQKDIHEIMKVQNMGTFSWKIPDVIHPEVRIRIQDLRDPENVFFISKPFQIVGDFVIPSSAVSETWKVGSEVRLAWETVGTIPQVRIDYISQDKGSQPSLPTSADLKILATGVDSKERLSQPSLNAQTRILQDKIPNQGFYSFRVPDWIADSGYFKISDVRDASVSRVWPPVKIQGNLSFRNPMMPQVWTVQQSQLLEWETQGTIPHVILEYSTDHFQNDIRAIQQAIPNSGKYVWQVPDVITSEVLVRVRDARDEKVSSLSAPIKIIGALQLTKPDAKQILKVGMPLAIEWNTTGTISQVHLEYSQDLKDFITIEENLLNEGHYTWPAPDQIAKEIWLRVSDAKNDTVLSVSREPIEIQGALEITSLQGSERFVVNEEQTFSWKTIGTIPLVRIEYSADGFQNEIYPVAEVSNTGTYRWKIPDFIHSQIQLRIMDIRDPKIVSLSKPFRIVGSLQMTSLIAPEIWVIGEKKQAEWITLGSIPKVRLEISRDGFQKDIKVLEASLNNEGALTWQVPDLIAPEVRLRVVDTRDDSVLSVSESKAEIRGALGWSRPLPGQIYTVGQEMLLEWNAMGSIPQFTLDYSTDGFQRDIRPMGEGTFNEKRYLWTVPDAIGAFQIRVQDTSNEKVAAILDAGTIRGAVEMVAPKRGEIFEVGKSTILQWRSQGLIPQVRLEYSGDGFNQVIRGIEPKVEVSRLKDENGLATYEWTIPDFISDQVQIRVTDVRDNQVFALSEPFKIRGSFEIISPEGGERWIAGSSEEILWKTVGTIPTVRMEYSRDGFQQDIHPIIGSIENHGKYDWVVADAVHSQVWIRVVDEKDPSVWAVHARPFEVQGILQWASSGAERWKVGDVVKLAWFTTGTIPEIKLEYIPVGLENQKSEPVLIAGQVPNQGNYSWQIPDSVPPRIQLRISDHLDPSVLDTTQAPAAILGILNVLSPAAKVNWPIGSMQEIVWESRGFIPQVKVEFSRDGFKNEVQTLFPLLSNTGSVQWTVGDFISKNFQIRISDIQNPEVFALTQAPIEITGGFRLLSPSPDAVLEVGTLEEISWQTLGTIPSVRIEYSNDHFNHSSLIADALSNTGHFQWKVPDTLGDRYEIRISDALHLDMAATSERPFSIQGRLVLKAPLGGEIWKVGTDVEIAWDSIGTIPNVTLEYSTDDFAHVSNIIDNLSNTGRFTWRIPDIVSDKVKVRVRDAKRPLVYSTMVQPLKIQGGLAMMAPQSGEFWETGTLHTILWQTVGSIPYVSIEYSSDNFATTVPVILGVVNEGRYQWTVPDLDAETLRFRILDAHDNSVFAVSESLEIGGTLKLISPQGGEVWTVGDNAVIQWKTGGTMPRVKIEISSDSFHHQIQTLEASAPNTGNYQWVVPDQIFNQYQIRVTDAKNPRISDTSQGTFKIAGTLTLTSPRGGEVWSVGSSQTMEWQSRGTIPFVRIEYSKDDFLNTTPISTQIKNLGHFTWEIPDLAGEKIRLKISDAGDPTITSEMIQGIEVKPLLTLVSPQNGELWKAEDSQPITWKSTGTVPYVNLEYSTNDFQEIETIASSIANTGSYLWTVPNISVKGLKVRVVDSTDTSVTAESRMPVQVLGEIQLTSPVGGEVWMVGSEHPITWTSTGNIPRVRIEYSMDGFRRSFPIAVGVPNEGHYNWTVLDAISKQGQIRVTQDTDSQIFGENERPFEIRGALNLLTPVGGEAWVVGSRHPISWQTTGTLPQVRLEYSSDDFVSDIQTIVTSLDNKGLYYWEVPSLYAPGIKIRVSDPTYPDIYDISKADVMLQGELQLLAPAGGESFQVGDRVEVLWRATPNIANVKLEYSFDDFESSKVISDFLPNTGKFIWNIPNQISNDWKVRVSDATNQTVFAFSKVPFRTHGNLEMISPKGGELWPAGSKQNITWNTLGVIPKVRLEYSADNFETALPMATNIDNTGSYLWTVPEIPYPEIRFRITASDSPSLYSTSQGPVNIVGKLQLISPNPGERWVVGEERILRWQTLGFMPLVDIEYSKDNFNKDIHLIASKTPNVGSYGWKVPHDPSTDVRIRVRNSENTKIVTVSEAPFLIDLYRIIWRVRDSKNNEQLSGLTMTDSTGKTVSRASSPTDFEYPYGIYTTVWTKPGYAEFTSTWLADRDRTFEVLLEPQTKEITLVRASFDYDRDKDFMKITTWYEKDGKPIPAVIQSEVKIYKKEEAVKSLVSTTPDAQGYFHMLWDTTTMQGDVKYFASVAVTSAAGKIYTSPISYQLDIPVKEHKEPLVRRAIPSVNLRPLGTAVSSLLPKKTRPSEKPVSRPTASPSETPAEEKIVPTKESMMEKSGTLKVPTPAAAPEVSGKESVLIVPKTAVIHETVSITYVGQSGVRPVLDLYDSNRKLVVRAQPMKETAELGTYTLLIPIQGLQFIAGNPVRISVIELATGKFKSAEMMIASAPSALGYEKQVGSNTVLEILQRLDGALREIQNAEKTGRDIPEVLATLNHTVTNLAGMLSEDAIDGKVLAKMNQVAEGLAAFAKKKGYNGAFLTANPLNSQAGLDDVNQKMRDMRNLIQSLQRLYSYSAGRTQS